MAKRKRRLDRTRSKPLTLEALREYGALDGFSPPEGEFDPEGAWKHTYRLWLVSNGPKGNYRGFVELERRPSPETKTVSLNVQQTVIMPHHPAVSTTKAALSCADDALLTPTSWQLTSVILDAQMKPMDITKVEEAAMVKSGTIEVKTGGRTAARKVPEPFTSNWSLFDAVQRLPADTMPPMEFALLEGLDMLKEGQRLSYKGNASIELAGKLVALHCYEQIGQGILPYGYCVDEQHRLLFAISGIRAYIFDPNVRERHKEFLDTLMGRTDK